MAFYYVMTDNVTNGTATGDAGRATTTRTGAFSGMAASSYYASLDDVYSLPSTPVGEFDFVIVSDSHDITYAAGNITVSANLGTVVSVDKDDISVTKIGAKESTSGGGDYTLLPTSGGTKPHFIGIEFACDDNLNLGDDCNVVFDNCTFSLLTGSSSDFIGSTGTGASFTFNNCIFNFNNFNTGINIKAGSFITLNGGVFNGGYGSFTANNSGGGVILLERVDFSAVTLGSNRELFNFGSNNFDDSHYIQGHRCKLPANTIFLENLSIVAGTILDFESCTDPNNSDDPDAYYYEYHERYEGVWDAVTGGASPVRNATYDGTNKISLELATNANSQSFIRPIRAKLMTIPSIDLTTDKTFEIGFTSNASLDDHMFWFEIVTGGTDEALGTIVKSNAATDILATPTNYTDIAANDGWTNPLTEVYKTSQLISGVTGLDNTIVEIYVCLAQPNTTVNVDYEVVVT